MMSEDIICQTIVQPLLETLSYTHSCGILHRDIKVENLFLTQAGELKLGDFGLALNVALERPTARVGTLDYMSPEVLSIPTPEECMARGLSPQDVPVYDEKVDIWAVGILAYELLTGRPPFEALHKDPKDRPNAAQLLQHPWFQPAVASPAQQVMLRDGGYHNAQPSMPGGSRVGPHQGYATVPHPTFMPTPWPRTLLDELNSQSTACVANAVHPPAEPTLPGWGVREPQNQIGGRLAQSTNSISPPVSAQAHTAAEWQPLQSSWKGAALQAPAARASVPEPAEQALIPNGPGPSPSAKYTAGSSSAFELPKHGFLRLQPGLAAAWDMDGPEPPAGPRQPAAWPTAASPFGHQAVQHAQQQPQITVPRASTSPKAMDWQPSFMPQAAENAMDAMANPRRQNSTAVLIAPPSNVPPSMQSASAETSKPDCKLAKNRVSNQDLSGFPHQQHNMQAPDQEQPSKAWLESSLQCGETMPKLQSSQSVPTFKAPSSRSVMRPCALHSSLGWGVPPPMQHCTSGPIIRQSLPDGRLSQPAASKLPQSSADHRETDQQGHAAEQMNASSEMLTIAGVNYPVAGSNPVPADTAVSSKPAQGRSAAEAQILVHDMQAQQASKFSKEPGLIRLSTGGDTPAWRISAHDWIASHGVDPVPSNTTDAPHAAKTSTTPDKQEFRTQIPNVHNPESSDGIRARSPPPSASSPAQIHHNPLYNDVPMGVYTKEQNCQVGAVQAAPTSSRSPSSIDRGSSSARHEQMIGPSFSAPALDADHEDLQLSQSRFSGTGTVPPKPKRLALEPGLCSPLDRQMLLRRAHSEPLQEHGISPDSLLQHDSQTADDAHPAVLHAEAGIAAGTSDQPTQANLLWTAVESHADRQLRLLLDSSGQMEDMERHSFGVPRRVENEPIMELAGDLQGAQHRQGDARSVPSRGPSSITVSSSSGASALSSRQSSRSAVAWPNWAEIQAQCSSSANLAAAAAASSGAMRHQTQQRTDVSSADKCRGSGSGPPMQPSVASSVPSMFPAQSALPLSLPNGLFPFHLERPTQDHGILSALFVAPHPHELMPRRVGPGLAPEQAMFSELQLPGASSSLQRTNSFNNRMRNWFLKRKA
ncbi:hypothetical protein WJX74_005089 [Apatococcus lobatus]|uniref:Protein kinase domain-containing protein n=1 Tax=Apatococcus lobatus TaxID=904363 RepID=A0AAW1SAM1_9CHLO